MVRLATFNVQHARLPDGRVDPGYLAEAVASLGCDVVALQEVERGRPRSGGADLGALVAQAVGARDHRFAPAISGPRPVARRRSRGDERDAAPGYGVALISRLPVTAWHVIRLPRASWWRRRGLGPGSREPRVALAAEIPVAGGVLSVVTTHLSVSSTWNQHQLRWLVEQVAHLPRPLVLLGDLNQDGSIPSRISGLPDLVDLPTFPRLEPRLTADHVLADGVRAASPATAVDLGISDHRAVVVDVVLMPDTAEARAGAPARARATVAAMNDAAPGRNETVEERSDRNWNELLQELRVMQTGVQILTGFLLTVPFQPRFEELTLTQRDFYLVLMVTSALVTGLVVGPVALHRALFRHHLKNRLVTVADRMTRAALALLALLVAGVVGLVFDVVAGRPAAVVALVVTLVVLCGLWVVLPGTVRSRRRT